MKFKIHKVHHLSHDMNEEWDTIIEGFNSKEEAEEYLIKENFKKSWDDLYYLSGYGICTSAIIKKDVDMVDKYKIFEIAMEEASKVLGADPAYFGDEGTEEVEKQLNKLGYTLESLRKMYVENSQ